MKENDIILNMLANPEFSAVAFLAVGLTAENTNLRPLEDYKNSTKITSNPKFLNDDGEFDSKKLEDFYLQAALMYNQIATNDYEQSVLNSAQYSPNNIFVEPHRRTLDLTPKLTTLANPNLTTRSLEEIGKLGRRTMSVSEIAQTLKIFDTETKTWTDSPNESFFDNFTNTLVLATYDEDIFDENGELIHQKGETKYNEDGLPYYETLGGRDVYGKQVLSKFNTLTTDGSFWNEFDFFDTDDIEQKSAIGTLARNAVLVGSMFIPYVGPWITGISVSTQLLGILASMGKIITGNENETLNNIQGWAKSVSRHGLTEYAANHTWCLENMLNLVGDVVGQLKEQRWIFLTAAPALTGHNQARIALSGKKGYDQVYDDILKDLNRLSQKTIDKLLLGMLGSNKILDPKKQAEALGIIASLQNENKQKAINKVNELIEAATKESQPIARAYMVGLVAQDTYGQARLAGASHLEAAFLTVGFMIGENAILKTNIGKWMMPETQILKFKYLMIQQKLAEKIKPAFIEATTTEAKRTFAKKVLDIGKNIANGQYALGALVGASPFKIAGLHGLAEATEEVSEELWADISKSIFNAVRWLGGKESLELGQWDNVFDRYAMSAIGGFGGGTFASIGTNFTQIRDLSQMDGTQAMNEVLHIIINNKESEFFNSLQEQQLGNKNLSTLIINVIDGVPIYAEGTENDNQDKAVKDTIIKAVSMARDILRSEGAAISKDSLLNELTSIELKDVLKQLTFGGLQNTLAIESYFKEYVRILSKIVSKKAEIEKLKHSTPDTAEPTNTVLDKIAKLEEELDVYRKKKDAFSNGKMSAFAIRNALFEINPLLNHTFIRSTIKSYAEAKFNKSWDELSKEEQKEARNEYFDSKKLLEHDIYTRALDFHNMLELFSEDANKAIEYAKNLLDVESLTKLQKFALGRTSRIFNDNLDSVKYLDLELSALQFQDLEALRILGDVLFSEEVENELKNLYGIFQETLTTDKKLQKDLVDLETSLKGNEIDQDTYELQKINLEKAITENREKSTYLFEDYNLKLNERIAEILDEQINKIEKLGYVHPEVRRLLLDIINQLNNNATKLYLDDFTATEKQLKLLQNLSKYKKLLQDKEIIKNTPIIEFLDRFALTAVNTEVKMSLHLQEAINLIHQAKEKNNLSELLADSNWETNNKEALLLVDSFIAAMEGLKVDNADIFNPTGYSKMINTIFKAQGIEDFKELAEIDSETANLFILDAYLIRNRLQYIENLNKLNRGQKLTQQVRVEIKKNYLIYQHINNFIKVAIPDDWKKDDKTAREYLEGTLNSIKYLKELKEDTLVVSDEIKKELNREMLILENAIYEVFEQNKNGNVWKQQDLQYIISKLADTGGYFLKTGNLLNETTKYLDTNSFIWWLASRATLRASDFQVLYEKALLSDLAPIASQELGIYLGIAGVVNVNAMNAFLQAYQKAIILDFKSLNIEERKKYLKLFKNNNDDDAFALEFLNYFINHDVVPLFENIFFFEGGPGTGKSKGIFKGIVSVLKQLDPDLLKNVRYVHTTTDNARTTSEAIGLEAIYDDKKSFMQYISNDWKDVLLKNEKTILLYKDSYEFTKEGLLINKWKVNKDTNAPRILFIDEITHYNQQELCLIKDWALENGVIIFAAGDIDLNTLKSEILLEGKPQTVKIARNFFMRTPKLGLSLRTNNRLMSQSIINAQLAIEELRKGQKTSFSFSYLNDHDTYKGLYGVMIKDNLKQAKEDILLLIDTATEKITFIYNKEDSEIYKYLMNTYGTEKIDFKKNSHALGNEGQYYIVEPDLTNEESYVESLYTGITRAEQGALIITEERSIGNVLGVTTQKDNIFLKEPLPAKEIEKFYNKKKKELLELLKDFEKKPVQIVKYEKNTSVITPPTQIPEKLEGFLLFDEEISTKKSYLYDSKLEAEDLLLNYYTNVNDNNLENNGNLYTIKDIIVEEEDGYFTPYIVLNDDTKITLAEALTNYTIKSPSPIPAFSNLSRFNITKDGKEFNIEITDIIIENDVIKYKVKNLEEDIDLEILESDLKLFINGLYKKLETEDPYLANNTAQLQKAIEAENASNIPPLVEFSDYSEINNLLYLYTFNDFLLGVSLENDEIRYDGLFFDQRIDNGIGLLKLYGYKLGQQLPGISDKDLYRRIEEGIATLKHIVCNTKSENNQDVNSIILNNINEYLFENDPNKSATLIIYAIKSSAKDQNNPEYALYYKAPNERTSYVKSGENLVPRRELVLLLKRGDETIFELSLATLGSPLTLMQQRDANGQYIYAELFSKFNTNMDPNLTNEPLNLFDNINSIISEYEMHPDENIRKYHVNLINLFKLWQMTSNGIFYFGSWDGDGNFIPSDFNLSDSINLGPLLIINKGMHLIDPTQFLYNAELEEMYTFISNPQLKTSYILQVNENLDNGLQTIKKNHSFILVSTDLSIDNTDKLVQEFEAGNPQVKRFYVQPPFGSISDWLLNEQNNRLNNLSLGNETIYKIGNLFTSFRILLALQDNLDSLPSGIKNSSELIVKEALAKLEEIEKKWSADIVTFNNTPLQGSLTDSELYDYYSLQFDDKRAKEMLRILELKLFLESKIDSNGKKITNAQQFTDYLLEMVYPHLMNQLFGFNEDVLNQIQTICANKDLKNIHYTPSKTNINYGKQGRFIKINASNYSLLINGKELPFMIHSAIDSPVLVSSTIFKEIARHTGVPNRRLNGKILWSDDKTTTSFYFSQKDSTWKLTTIGQYGEKNYLPKKEDTYLEEPSVSETIKRKYANFENILNFSLLLDNKSEIENLNILINDLNNRFNRYLGIVNNSKLILFDTSLIEDFTIDTFSQNENDFTFVGIYQNKPATVKLTLSENLDSFDYSITYKETQIVPISPTVSITEEEFESEIAEINAFNSTLRGVQARNPILIPSSLDAIKLDPDNSSNIIIDGNKKDYISYINRIKRISDTKDFKIVKYIENLIANKDVSEEIKEVDITICNKKLKFLIN